MPMNSKHTSSLPEFSKGRWADEPLQPPPHSRADEPPQPPPHPTELSLVTRVQSWLGELAPLTTVRSWLSELASLTSAWLSRTELTPLTFARYLIAFFIGVVATVAWQSYRGGIKEETAATPAALDSMRQSIEKLAAEMTKIRSVEQDILGKISAPPPPVAAPARNPSQRQPSVR